MVWSRLRAMLSDAGQVPGWDEIKANIRWGGLIAAAIMVAVIGISIASGHASVAILRSAAGEGLLSRPAATVTFLLGMQVAMIVLTLLVASLEARSISERLGLTRRDVVWPVFAGAALGGLVLTGSYTLLGLLAGWSNLQRDLAPFAELLHSPQWFWAILAVVVGAPLSEELLFRGLLFPALVRRWLRLPGAALISTVAWTSLHAGYSATGLIEVLLFGLYFCWLLRRTGSLLVSIVCHGVVNAVTMILVSLLF